MQTIAFIYLFICPGKRITVGKLLRFSLLPLHAGLAACHGLGRIFSNHN